MGGKGDFDISGSGGADPRDEYAPMNEVLPSDFPVFDDGAGEIEEIPGGLPTDTGLYYFASSYVFNTFPGSDGYFGFSNDTTYADKKDNQIEVVEAGDYWIDFTNNRIYSYSDNLADSYMHICERQIQITVGGPLAVRSVRMVREVGGSDVQKWHADAEGERHPSYPAYKPNINNNAKLRRVSLVPDDEEKWMVAWAGTDGQDDSWTDDDFATEDTQNYGVDDPASGAPCGGIGVFNTGFAESPKIDKMANEVAPKMSSLQGHIWGAGQYMMISHDEGHTWNTPWQWPADGPYCNFGPSQWGPEMDSIAPFNPFTAYTTGSPFDEAVGISRTTQRVYLITTPDFGTDLAYPPNVPGARGMYGVLYTGLDIWGNGGWIVADVDLNLPGLGPNPGINVAVCGTSIGMLFRGLDNHTNPLNPYGNKESALNPWAWSTVLNVTGDPDWVAGSWRLKDLQNWPWYRPDGLNDSLMQCVWRMYDGTEIFKVYRSYDYGATWSYHATLPTHSQAANRGFGQLVRLNTNGMWAFFTARQAAYPNPGNYLFLSDDDMANWTRVFNFVTDSFTFASGSAGGDYLPDFTGYVGRTSFSHGGNEWAGQWAWLTETDDYTPVMKLLVQPSSNAQTAPLPTSNYYYGWFVEMELGRTTVTVDKVICDEAGFVIRAPHINELRSKLMTLNATVQTGGTNRVNFGIDVSDLPTVSQNKTAVRAEHYEICKRETDKVIGQVGTDPGGPYYSDTDLIQYALLMPDPVVDDPVSIRTLIGMRKTLQALYADGYFCACYSYCPCQTHFEFEGGGSKK